MSGSFNFQTKSSVLKSRTDHAGCEIAACQVPNSKPKWGTGMPKNIWMAKLKGKLQAKIFLDCQKKF